MVDFLKYRTISLIFSFSILAAFVGVYIQRGGFTYSVDFTGGTQVLLRFDKPVSSVEVKAILDKKGWPGATTRDFSETEVLVRVKDFTNDAKGLGERIRQILGKELKSSVDILQSEGVGPGVGASLRWKSIKAVLIALIVLLLYIAFRFWSFAFAAGAVVALFHDALIMLAVFLFLDREISVNVIGALLAVLGYSINDTIVIFSRIRDNINKMQDTPLAQIVNVSLNQTLKRTLLTSISTALTVGSMFVLGGEALRDFSLALLVGIVFGTYSSIYIASPVMLLLQGKKS